MANGNELVIRVVGDSTQFTRTITQVNAAINRAGGNATRMGSTFQAAGHSSVTSVQAISASLRLAEGGFTGLLRAGERFIALSPRLSSIAQAIFPLVGGVAVASIFVKMGKEAYEFTEQVRKIPEAARQAAQSFNVSQESTLSHLLLENDQLDRQIAKLEHKPDRNGAKEALDEAFASAVQFTQQLDETQKKLTEVLKAGSVSQWQSLVSSVLGNRLGVSRGVEEFTNSSIFNLQQLDYQRTQALRQGRTADADNLSQQFNVLRDKTISKAQNQINLRSGNVHYGPGNQLVAGADAAGISLPYSSVEGNQSGNLTTLQALVTSLQTLTQIGDLQSAAKTKQGQIGTITGANDFARQAAALAKQQEDALHDRVSWRDNQVKTWQSMTAADSEEAQKQIDISQKWADALSKIDDEVLKKRQEFMKALEKHNDQMADILSKNGFALQENDLNRLFQSGQLSPLAASKQAAQLHTQQYQSDYSRLVAAIQAAQNSNDTNEQYRLEEQLAELQGRRSIEEPNDQERIRLNTVGGAFSDSLNQFVTESKNAAEAMRNVVTGTLNSLNNDILNGKGFKQTGSDLFRSAAGYSLRGAKGAVLSAFRVGGGKADGTAANPFFVKSVDAQIKNGSNLFSSAAGLISSLFHRNSALPLSAIAGASDPLGLTGSPNGGGFGFLSGFFAKGGTPLPDSDIVVGEEGPEVWHVPSGSSGSIIPNGALGGTTNHVYIDATGADAGVEERIHRAMSKYIPYTVGAAVQATNERQKRRPLSAR